MAKTRTEREQDARQAKLDNVSAQVSSGQLVIREMSKAERARWEKQHAFSEARATPGRTGSPGERAGEPASAGSATRLV